MSTDWRHARSDSGKPPPDGRTVDRPGAGATDQNANANTRLNDKAGLLLGRWGNGGSSGPSPDRRTVDRPGSLVAPNETANARLNAKVDLLEGPKEAGNAAPPTDAHGGVSATDAGHADIPGLEAPERGAPRLGPAEALIRAQDIRSPDGMVNPDRLRRLVDGLPELDASDGLAPALADRAAAVLGDPAVTLAQVSEGGAKGQSGAPVMLVRELGRSRRGHQDLSPSRGAGTRAVRRGAAAFGRIHSVQGARGEGCRGDPFR